MKRIILATAGVALVAVVAAAFGSAQPTATTTTARSAAKAPPLPKLPADIAGRKRLIVGVKCDTPPFGYIDVRGKNAGIDVEIAKWFARYAFGRQQRLTFVCAPTAAREPLLTTNRVDLVISTFSYSTEPGLKCRSLTRSLRLSDMNRFWPPPIPTSRTDSCSASIASRPSWRFPWSQSATCSATTASSRGSAPRCSRRSTRNSGSTED